MHIHIPKFASCPLKPRRCVSKYTHRAFTHMHGCCAVCHVYTPVRASHRERYLGYIPAEDLGTENRQTGPVMASAHGRCLGKGWGHLLRCALSFVTPTLWDLAICTSACCTLFPWPLFRGAVPYGREQGVTPLPCENAPGTPHRSLSAWCLSLGYWG